MVVGAHRPGPQQHKKGDDWSSWIILKNILFMYKYFINVLTHSLLQSDYRIGQDSLL